MIDTVLAEVREERLYQMEKWGNEHDDCHHRHEWVSFLTRYLGDASKALEYNRSDLYRRHLIELAALAVAAVEVEDRKIERANDVS